MTAALTSGALCKGYGGLEIAAEMLLGPMEPLWYAEFDPATTASGKPVPQYAAQLCAAHWPDVPNLGDLTAIDWAALPRVDVLTAGFPCTDVSAAGKRAGLKPGTRTGIWSHIAHGIGVLRPRLVLLENVEGLLSGRAHSDVEPCPWCLGDADPELVVRALGAVLADLADLGFDAEWTTVAASDVGAPHRRRRVFIVAWPADCPPDGTLVAGRVGVGAAADDGVSLLPTPRASDTGTPGRRASEGFRPPLSEVLLTQLLPTPTSRDHKGHNQRGDTSCLTGALLPTPRTNDMRGPGLHGAGGPDLRTAVTLLPSAVFQLLPTPTSQAAKHSADDRGPGTLDDFNLWSVVTREAQWGRYAGAIARWEAATGRPAPDATEPGTKGQQRLAPAFVEWLMGLPAGWVTDHLPRNGALKVLGNGVVPQQAAYAYAELLAGVS